MMMIGDEGNIVGGSFTYPGGTGFYPLKYGIEIRLKFPPYLLFLPPLGSQQSPAAKQVELKTVLMVMHA